MSIYFDREEIRTDAVGPYRVYIYPDGHEETEPPGRPLTKEDLQRRRLAGAVHEKRNTMARAMRTTRQGGRQPDAQRQTEHLPTFRALTQPVHDTLNAFARVSGTARAPDGYRKQLIQNYDLGGYIPGRVNPGSEAAPAKVHIPGKAKEREYPREVR